MLIINKLIKNFHLWKNEFSPYHNRNNEFFRVATIHSIIAFIVCPIYSIIIAYSVSPEIYFYFGLSYTVFFPIYLLISWTIKILRDKLLYFFFFHLFIITLFAFYSLYQAEFESFELYMFSGLFVVCSIVIQRLYSLFLYVLLVCFLFIYSFLNVKIVLDETVLIFVNLIIIGISVFIVLLIRLKMYSTVENYSKYLQQIIDSSGSGYILFNLSKDKMVVDFNKEIKYLFNLKEESNNEVQLNVLSFLSIKNLKEISLLSVGKTYKKRIKINNFGIAKNLEFNITILEIQRNILWLARINDITEELAKIEALELSEKRCRNLYEKNKAGVFTVNRDSTIMNGNTAFFSMLDSLCTIGDKLFSIDVQKDWNLILELLGENEFSQNYQTQFKLINGKEKTFIFNWYLDKKTNLIEGSVIDLTKNQKASLALKQSEEKYRLIYEETNDAILFLEGDKIIDANRKSTQLFGLIREDLLKLNLFELSYETNNKSQEIYNKIRNDKGNARTVKFKWIFKRKGTKIEAEVALIEVTIDKKIFYQCVIQDRTKSNEYIRSVEKTQQNLTNILENHPEGIIIIRNKIILFTNPEIDKILGLNIDFRDIIKQNDLEKFNTLYDNHMIDRERKNTQLSFNDYNNKKILMDITLASTIFEEEDAVMIILKDVSVKNKVEREKLRAEIAEESNKQLAIEIKEKIFAEKQLEEQFLRMKAIFDSSSNTFLLTLTLNSEISTFNTHCKAYFTKILRKKIVEGDILFDYLTDIISKIRLRFLQTIFYEIKKGKSKQFELDIEANGIHHWLEVFVNPIFNTEGKVSEISLVAHDISEKKTASINIESSLKEKEILLKEIHHRVKNNLQVISSILNLQSSFVEDDKTISILQESRNRVRTMAIIHENLYRTENFASINFSNYIDNLTGNLISSYKINEEIVLNKELNEVQLVLDQAIPCGLVVNEIITNSLKYAWNKDEKGIIFISLKEENNKVILELSDNGIGLPFDFNKAITDTLGLQLVTTLIEQLDGEINVDNNNGTKYLIKFDKIKT